MTRFSISHKEDYTKCTEISPGTLTGRLIVFAFTCLNCGYNTRFGQGYYIDPISQTKKMWQAGLEFSCGKCGAEHRVDSDLNLVHETVLEAFVVPEGATILG